MKRVPLFHDITYNLISHLAYPIRKQFIRLNKKNFTCLSKYLNKKQIIYAPSTPALRAHYIKKITLHSFLLDTVLKEASEDGYFRFLRFFFNRFTKSIKLEFFGLNTIACSAAKCGHIKSLLFLIGYMKLICYPFYDPRDLLIAAINEGHLHILDFLLHTSPNGVITSILVLPHYWIPDVHDFIKCFLKKNTALNYF